MHNTIAAPGRLSRTAVLAATLSCVCAAALCDDTAALAKATQNPIANVVVPNSTSGNRTIRIQLQLLFPK